jgi:hypothetical protein
MHRHDGIYFDDLPETTTYKVRHWLYVRADLAAPDWDGMRCGTLVIVQGRSATPGTIRDTGIYAVQELLNAGPGGRQFLLVKQNEPGTTIPADVAEDDAKDDICEVFLGEAGLPPKCDCDAGKAGRPACKHRDALAAVVAKGAIPEPEAAEEDLP